MDKENARKIAYTIAEAKAVLPVSRISLYRGIESGKIPHRRLMNRILIPAEWVESFGEVQR